MTVKEAQACQSLRPRYYKCKSTEKTGPSTPYASANWFRFCGYNLSPGSRVNRGTPVEVLPAFQRQRAVVLKKQGPSTPYASANWFRFCGYNLSPSSRVNRGTPVEVLPILQRH